MGHPRCAGPKGRGSSECHRATSELGSLGFLGFVWVPSGCFGVLGFPAGSLKKTPTFGSTQPATLALRPDFAAHGCCVAFLGPVGLPSLKGYSAVVVRVGWLRMLERIVKRPVLVRTTPTDVLLPNDFQEACVPCFGEDDFVLARALDPTASPAPRRSRCSRRRGRRCGEARPWSV